MYTHDVQGQRSCLTHKNRQIKLDEGNISNLGATRYSHLLTYINIRLDSWPEENLSKEVGLEGIPLSNSSWAVYLFLFTDASRPDFSCFGSA